MRLKRKASAAFFMSIWAMCLPAIATAAPCFDPVPNPSNAGWTKEGNGGFQSGTPLTVTDPSIAPGDFTNFFCTDATIFTGEIVLTPRFSIESAGFIAANDGNTGIHVTINDGTKFARAFIIQIAPGSFKVALAVAGGGYSNGFPIVGSIADYTLRRNADGSATLAVPNPVVGNPPLEETVLQVDLADSLRTGSKTLEFGTASNVQGASVTR